MLPQEQIDFNRIAEAIDYLKNNYQSSPSLEQVAAHVNMSATHFQKMFTAWAGVSPKVFLQFITIKYAKLKLRKEHATLFNTTADIGLSSTSRLHDLFIKIEGMTAGEYKNGGIGLTINYSFVPSNFGDIIIAKTNKGISYIAFYEEEAKALSNLISNFPNAKYIEDKKDLNEDVLKIINKDFKTLKEIKLHLKGTTFQIKVWEALLKIPFGDITTYGEIAKKIDSPKAARAAGTAIGSNPVAYLIPCHRIIQATGIFGGYMWGPKRKTAILGWESALLEKENLNL
jgi:AraC family transcriptional regulator, regulatory protein of adaptative response / methylated-DNA-[protein]-cysteine methyltransferase